MFSNDHRALSQCNARPRLILFEIKTEGQSIYTENLNAKLKNSIQIPAYCGIA